MADINEYLEENIKKMFEERDEFEDDKVKERTQHDKNIAQMVNGYGQLKRIEAEREIEGWKVVSSEEKAEADRNLEERKLDDERDLAERRLDAEAIENERDYELRKDQLDKEEKASKRKFRFGVIGLLMTAFFHLIARRDSREGIIPDERLSFFDKGFNLITKFIK